VDSREQKVAVKKGDNAAAKNSVHPSEGVAGGGGLGEESRHARAEKESSQPRRPARQSRATQKSFLFLSEEKIRRAQIGKSKENFFVGWRALASGGGAASSLGVLRKVSSDFFKQTPPGTLLFIPVYLDEPTVRTLLR
jgi:hypothetical protein